MMKIFLPFILLVLTVHVSKAQCNYVAPSGMVQGGQFTDRILPITPSDSNTEAVWGAKAVRFRDVYNGLEDSIHSYWGGNIIKGEDDKYHLFVCRWPHNKTFGNGTSGHKTWWDSDVVHAVSNAAIGPYKVVDEIGKGHNPEIYRNKNGGFTIGVMGFKAYQAPSLNGPWKEVETTFQWLVCEQIKENRTYTERADGSVLMMAKNGYMYISEGVDEHFIQLTDVNAMNLLPDGHMEDPVIWRDEVQYNCIYNDAHGRVAFYMRSKDGLKWKWMEGVAYRPDVLKHTDGTVEEWYKLERPKILQDEFGRATHLNIAALDTIKDYDLANDVYGSKNIVVPLIVPRRIRILNDKRIHKNTKEIKLKILAEPGFNPNSDVDVKSLRLGAPELVNFGDGCAYKSSLIDGDSLIVTFKGKGNGIEDHNFAAKLIGKEKSGALLFGYAALKELPAAKEDEILSHTILDEIPKMGVMKFAVEYSTSQKRNICVQLVNTSKGKVLKGKVQKSVSGNGLAILTYEKSVYDSIFEKDKYRFEVYLSDIDNGQLITDKITKDVIVLTPDSPKDRIISHSIPYAMPISREVKFTIDYETKKERLLSITLLDTEGWKMMKSSYSEKINGKGTATVHFKMDDSEVLKADNKYLFFVNLLQTDAKEDGRVAKTEKRLVKIENNNLKIK